MGGCSFLRHSVTRFSTLNQKTTLASYEQAIRFSEMFSFCEDIRDKPMIGHIVVDYADTRFSNLVIENIHENENVRETKTPVHVEPR